MNQAEVGARELAQTLIIGNFRPRAARLTTHPARHDAVTEFASFPLTRWSTIEYDTDWRVMMGRVYRTRRHTAWRLRRSQKRVSAVGKMPMRSLAQCVCAS
jgi:hypothetical protein